MRRALEDEFEIAGARDFCSEGDLARQALIVFVQDSQTREVISTLSKGTAPQRFEPVTTVSIVAAALIALQTHVRF
jgi:hypothetical protein